MMGSICNKPVMPVGAYMEQGKPEKIRKQAKLSIRYKI